MRPLTAEGRAELESAIMSLAAAPDSAGLEQGGTATVARCMGCSWHVVLETRAPLERLGLVRYRVPAGRRDWMLSRWVLGERA
jgi:hypothetical protein